MKAKELAEWLMENPDFDVEFRCFDYFTGESHKYIDIGINDIKYSDRVIILDGIVED